MSMVDIWKPLANEWSTRVVTVYHGRRDEAIQVFLEEVDLRLDPQYMALSYTWGDEWSQGEIYVNGQRHRISKNLYHVLLIIRDEVYDKHVWIDALSISQVDPAEKANHIGLIGKIFQQATHVVAWVGPSEPDGLDISQLHEPLTDASYNSLVPRRSIFRKVGGVLFHPEDQVKLALSKLSSRSSTDSRRTTEYRNRAAMLSKLLQRKYFQRTWIVQELIFSRNITFHCDFDTISWETLMGLIEEISNYDPKGVRDTQLPFAGSDWTDEIGHVLYNPNLKRVNLIEKYRRAYRANQLQDELVRLIHKFADTQQSLPHDRVYALLELETRKGLERPLKVNYDLNMGQLFVQVLRDRTCAAPEALSPPSAATPPKPWVWDSRFRGLLAKDPKMILCILDPRTLTAVCLIRDLRIDKASAVEALEEAQNYAHQDQSARSDKDLFAVANACAYLYGDTDEGGYGRLKHALNTLLGLGHRRKRWEALATRNVIAIRERNADGAWVTRDYRPRKHSHHLNVFDDADSSTVAAHGLASVSHSHAAHPSRSAPGMGVPVELGSNRWSSPYGPSPSPSLSPGFGYPQARGPSSYYGGLPPTSMNLPYDPYSYPNARW